MMLSFRSFPGFGAAFSLLFSLTVLFAGCNATDTPSDAYKRLYTAVKERDIDAIRGSMSSTSIEFAEMVAVRSNVTIEKVLENGFTATTYAETLPPMRDQRVSGETGAVEVWNARDRVWEDLPFVRENGEWKLAIGDQFKGTFQSPGKGQAAREREATNAMTNPPTQRAVPTPVNGTIDTNTNVAAKPR